MSRVMILSNTVRLGGADRQVVALAEGLARRGWQVRTIALSPLGPMALQAQDRGLEISSMNARGPTSAPRVLGQLIRNLRQWRPHVLHCHMFHANLFGRTARAVVGIPVVISTVRSIQEGSGWREGVYRWTDRLADATAQVSRAGAERYVAVKAVPKHKMRYMPNGVDTTCFRPCTATRARVRERLGLDSRFAWLAVGRFHPSKDYPCLLDAFHRLVASQPEAVLLIVGEGELRAEMERRAGQAGLVAQVRFLGPRSDVTDLMKATDAYVMSSAWEGMPNVLLEASASALPVVATNVAGNPEIVVDGDTGFLVPPHDPAALAAAMERLMGLPEAERGRMGAAARVHVENHFDIERQVNRWEELYLELLARMTCSPSVPRS